MPDEQEEAPEVHDLLWQRELVDPAEILASTPRRLARAAAEAGNTVRVRTTGLRVQRRRKDGMRPRKEGSTDMVANMVLVDLEVVETEVAVAHDGRRLALGVWETVTGADGKAKTAIRAVIGWRRDGTVRVAPDASWSEAAKARMGKAAPRVTPSAFIEQWMIHGADEVDPDLTPPTTREAALLLAATLGAQLVQHIEPGYRPGCAAQTPQRVQQHLRDMHELDVYPYTGHQVPVDPAVALEWHSILHEHGTAGSAHEHVGRPLGS